MSYTRTNLDPAYIEQRKEEAGVRGYTKSKRRTINDKLIATYPEDVAGIVKRLVGMQRDGAKPYEKFKTEKYRVNVNPITECDFTFKLTKENYDFIRGGRFNATSLLQLKDYNPKDNFALPKGWGIRLTKGMCPDLILAPLNQNRYCKEVLKEEFNLRVYIVIKYVGA